MNRLVVVARALFALCIACIIADTVLSALSFSLLSEQSLFKHGWPFAPIAIVGSSLLGWLVVSRYPRNLIGWLLTVAGASASISLLAEAYSTWVLREGGVGSEDVGHIAGWIATLIGGPFAFALLSITFYLLPDGTLQSRRWRWGVITNIVGYTIFAVAVCTVSPTSSAPSNDHYEGPVTETLFVVAFVFLAAGVGGAAVNLILRLRRSSGERRQQLRWITASASGLAFGLIWLLVVSAIRSDGTQSWINALPLFLAYVLLPIGIGIAVLRYRLYDIDVIINRTVLLAIGSAFAAAGYIGLVVGVGAAVGSTSWGFWPSLVATAAVAVAFQPLRTRVVQLADRMAYGPKAVPYEALNNLSQRIGESPDPEQLLPTVAQAAHDAVAATSVTVRLTLPSQAQRSARWPAFGVAPPARTNTTTFAVSDHDERLGSIDVEMPVGRTLRPRDHQLLAALAEQVGLAFRQARLVEQLAERVDELDRSAAELAESRERIIVARDDEQSRLESTISRDVTAHIRELPAQLAELSRTPEADRVTALPRLSGYIDRSVLALESLREITRGIFPTQLSRAGLPAAIAGQLGTTGTTGALTVSDRFGSQRFAAAIEAAAYYCYAEVIATLERPVQVELDCDGETLTLRLGGTSASDPNLAALHDRLDPWDGSAGWTREGSRVTVSIDLPVTVERDRALSTQR